jgi:hypothetical protein
VDSQGWGRLLVRLPGARHSRDLDLLHSSKHLDEAIKELAELAGRAGGDPFSFVVGAAVRMEGQVAGAQIKVDAYLGTTRFARFPIDLSTELHVIARVERRQPRPVVEVPGVDTLPEFTLYPLPDQVADKVCAMFEKHGHVAAPSSRYRDLVDLVLIIANLPLDAEDTITALASEAQRRGLTLPARPESPGPQWDSGYRAVARDTTLPADLRELPAALSEAGACLNPLLTREITGGQWEPAEHRWRQT